MDYKTQVAQSIKDAIGNDLSLDEIVEKIEVPKTLKMGDYAFPAFVLAKVMHKAPQLIASEIAEKVNQADYEKVEANGPYVNFFMDKKLVGKQIVGQVIEKQNHYGDLDLGHEGNVTIDMSSPNIAKPMSMGHLRSTVIGNSLAELLKKTNYQPIKINHLGDWGTQFGKLIEAYKLWGNEEEVKQDPINTLLKYYVRFHKEDQENPELDDEARAWFKKLEDGDEEATRLWKWFREESLKFFMKIYDRLGITFDSYNGEAFYNDKMQPVIDELKKKGLLEKSQGAEIVDLSKYDLNPALIQKSDGTSLYITRDLAAAIYRKNTYHFVQSLYVMGNEQSNHFHQLVAVLKEMGYDWADEMHHVAFGLITSGGKKLSTRRGNIILLEEVLDDAVKLAQEQIEEKNPTLTNKDEVANEVGVGAVVFHDLKNERLNQFDFDLQEVVRFEGETGPYVQYSHARAMSILRKAGMDEKAKIDVQGLADPAAWETIRLLGDFPDMVARAVEEYEPSVIAKYAIRLAKAFNKYYAHTKVLVDDDEKNDRLALVQSVAIVLKEALRLLGVKAPDEM